MIKKLVFKLMILVDSLEEDEIDDEITVRRLVRVDKSGTRKIYIERVKLNRD